MKRAPWPLVGRATGVDHLRVPPWAGTLALFIIIGWAATQLVVGGTGAGTVAAASVAIAAALLLCLEKFRLFLKLRSANLAGEEAQRRLSAVVQTSDRLAWEMDAEGGISYISPKSQEYLGYAPDELVGQHVDLLLPPEERPRAAQLMATSAAAGHGWTDQPYTFLTKDGRLRPYLSTGIAHVDAGGTVTGFAGLVQPLGMAHADPQQLARSRDRVVEVLQEQSIRTLFQPIVNTASGAVMGAEALSRFPGQPQQSPDRWFAEAWEVGLGIDLEILALRSALTAAEQLPPDIYVSVNLSPAALRSGRADPILITGERPSRQLVVEVTEHVGVADYASLVHCLQRLRRAGMRVAVDDAGAGYASFRHILQLAPDYIKLDQALVRGMDTDRTRSALVHAVASFALEVDLIVIAEGIETAAELEAARRVGVTAVQGYYLGRPTPPGSSWGVPEKQPA
ncbi:MAG: uncharacterized protein JWM67_432 [Mycobacterium sp.]|nr:uncharacterized protein [Mycobacterium sp.]